MATGVEQQGQGQAGQQHEPEVEVLLEGVELEPNRAS